MIDNYDNNAIADDFNKVQTDELELINNNDFEICYNNYVQYYGDQLKLDKDGNKTYNDYGLMVSNEYILDNFPSIRYDIMSNVIVRNDELLRKQYIIKPNYGQKKLVCKLTIDYTKDDNGKDMVYKIYLSEYSEVNGKISQVIVLDRSIKEVKKINFQYDRNMKIINSNLYVNGKISETKAQEKINNEWYFVTRNSRGDIISSINMGKFQEKAVDSMDTEKADENASKVETDNEKSDENASKVETDDEKSDENASKGETDDEKSDENGSKVETDNKKSDENDSKVETDGEKSYDNASKVEKYDEKYDENASQVETDDEKYDENGSKVETDNKKSDENGSKVETDGEKSDEKVSKVETDDEKSYDKFLAVDKDINSQKQIDLKDKNQDNSSNHEGKKSTAKELLAKRNKVNSLNQLINQSESISEINLTEEIKEFKNIKNN